MSSHTRRVLKSQQTGDNALSSHMHKSDRIIPPSQTLSWTAWQSPSAACCSCTPRCQWWPSRLCLRRTRLVQKVTGHNQWHGANTWFFFISADKGILNKHWMRKGCRKSALYMIFFNSPIPFIAFLSFSQSASASKAGQGFKVPSA